MQDKVEDEINSGGKSQKGKVTTRKLNFAGGRYVFMRFVPRNYSGYKSRRS